jgi:L-ribulose-5-phosphate 3-epimerase
MEHLQLSRRAVLSAASGLALAPSQAASPIPIRLGIVTRVRRGEDPARVVGHVRELGFTTCQISLDPLSKDLAKPLRRALEQQGVEATALMEHGPGRTVWNFYDGPLTIGLIPPATRQARIDALKLAADVAEEANIAAIHTHCGFLPENPNASDYKEGVAAIKDVAAHCKTRGRMFLFETGQETPITLLRAIHDIGLDNLGINLDVFGHWVRGLHAKDGLFPTDPRNLGREVAIGKGKVDFPKLIQRLKDVHYTGPMTIEREIQGPQQTKDILASKAYLENLLREAYQS